LLRTGLDAIRRGWLGIGHVGVRKSMLFFSRAVADPLEGAIGIRRARLVIIRSESFLSVFVLSGCPTRLAGIYK